MSREIKFRAWDKTKSAIRQVVELLFETKALYNVRLRCPAPGAPENWELRTFNEVELMQFTGLKDKNGKKAYFNDLVRLKDGYGGKDVVWQIEPDEYGAALFIRKTEPFKDVRMFVSDYYTKHPDDSFEVVGNIYENPELLNQGEGFQRSVASKD